MSSGLFGPLFGDGGITRALSDVARLQAMLDVEAALAEVEAQLEIIPVVAVGPIRDAARAELYDVDAIAAEAVDSGNIAVPLIRALTRQVAVVSPEAARYVHWGATSQDIIDTGFVLQLQAAVPLILNHLECAGAAAARLARDHIDTPMAGRTLLQQATPVTFGLKAAGWLDAVERQRLSLVEALRGTAVLQLGGASGTLAALGDRGID